MVDEIYGNFRYVRKKFHVQNRIITVMKEKLWKFVRTSSILNLLVRA